MDITKNSIMDIKETPKFYILADNEIKNLNLLECVFTCILLR